MKKKILVLLAILILSVSAFAQTAGTIYYDATKGMSLEQLRSVLPDYIEYNGKEDDGSYLLKERNDNGVVIRNINAYFNDSGLVRIKTRMLHVINCSANQYFRTRGNGENIQETYTPGPNINVSKDANAQIAIKKGDSGLYNIDYGAFMIDLMRPRMDFESIVKEEERGRYRHIYFSEGQYFEIVYGDLSDL